MTHVSDELIELGSLRFHFRDWTASSPDAPVLVLLHGYTGHARSWDAFAQAMTDRYRVLALDQRGHGETQWAAANAYSTDDMTGDLRAFVAALGLKQFALLGLSMGGSVAIRYAGAQPAELSKLVIVDIGPELVTEGLNRIQTSVRAVDVFDSRDQAFAAARGNNPRAPELHLRHRIWNGLMLTGDGRWTYRYDRALRDPGNPRPRLSAEENWHSWNRIAVPTLLVRGGESDLLSPQIAQRMMRENSKASRIDVAGAGHSVPLDQPDGFLLAVREFL